MHHEVKELAKVAKVPNAVPSTSDCVVVGGLAIDVTCNINASADKLVPSSYPGTTTRTLGGVGLNIAKASTFAGYKHGITTRLVSVIGKNDHQEVSSGLEKEAPSPVLIDQQGILISETAQTAQYIAMHDTKGDLIVACASMDIIKNMDPKFIEEHIKSAKPTCVLFDGNIGQDQKLATVRAARSVGALVGFEPTSVEKAAAIGAVPLGRRGQILKCVPNHTVDFSTPNVYELTAMHEKLQDEEYFDIENWFPVIDVLNLGSAFRNRMEGFVRAVPEISEILVDGTVQKAIQLLPYIPNLFVKLGPNGVILFQLLFDVETQIDPQLDQLGPNVTSSYDINDQTNVVSAYFAGRDDGGSKLGLLIQYFPAVSTNPSSIVSVTGAGDSFCGVLLAESARSSSGSGAGSGGDWLYNIAEKDRVLELAQKAASLTIQSEQSVSTKIIDL